MLKEGIKKAIPEYLRGKYQLIGTVVFTALFSIVFLLVSIPFSHNTWLSLGNSIFFLFTLIFAVFALLLIIFSKYFMYMTRHKLRMTFLGLVAWDIAEVVVICLVYTVLTVWITKIEWSGFMRTFANSLVYGTISIIIPYIISGMYFAIIDKNNTIRLMNYQNVVSDEKMAPSQLEKVALFDNSGVLRLSVNIDNLYYIESDDNYINAWYTDSNGDLKSYMLRCRLKTVEESFKGSSIVRCHRKYIVNMNKVKVLRREKDKYRLELDNNSIQPIPVTKTYSQNVLSLFNNKSAENNPEV